MGRYMREGINILKGKLLFLNGTPRRATLQIRDEMVLQLVKLVSKSSEIFREKLENDLKFLRSFKVDSYWFYSIIKQKHLQSTKECF